LLDLFFTGSTSGKICWNVCFEMDQANTAARAMIENLHCPDANQQHWLQLAPPMQGCKELSQSSTQ